MAEQAIATVQGWLESSGIAAAWSQYDAAVSNTVFDGLYRAGFTEFDHRKPSVITRGWPLVDSPTPVITLVAAYLLIVVVGIASIRLSKPAKQKADPFWLTLLVQAHNLFLIVLSAYMASTAVLFALRAGFGFAGNAYNPSHKELGRTIYIFYLSKIYEFMDTMIILLKGKLQQASLLHIYHHGSIGLIWWMIAYTAPGGDAWYSCALNSFVHVLMYSYYLMALLLSSQPAAKRKYLWWGRYLTQFQMFQFVTNMVQAVVSYYYGAYSRNLSRLLFFYMITLLVLFGRFYVQKYNADQKPRTNGKLNGKKHA